MTPRALLAEIRRRDRLLWAVGWLQVGLLAAMLVAAAFEARQVLGLNPWIKPLKFASSIALYVWTVAWMLGDVRGPRVLRWMVSGTVALSMVVEIACIALQSARGTRSHFNAATPFDGAVFSVMGTMIFLNTLAVALLLVLALARPAERPSPYRWGVRLGLLLFLAGSGVGGMMVTRNAHAVGVPDGGPGLPIVNWSTEAGDLRAAHLVWLHALQVLPLAGYLLSRAPAGRSDRARLGALVAFAAVYAALGFAVLQQALAGRPLPAWG